MCGLSATMDQEETKTRHVSGTHRYASAVLVLCLTLRCSHDASDQTATAVSLSLSLSLSLQLLSLSLQLLSLSLFLARALALDLAHTHNLASACRLTCLCSTPFRCFRKDKNGIADLTMRIGTTANQRGESTLQRMNQMSGLNGNERTCRAVCSVLRATCAVLCAVLVGRTCCALCSVQCVKRP